MGQQPGFRLFFTMSLPNSNSPRDRKFAADAMANPALQNFELFKRKPAGGDAVAPAMAEAAVNPGGKAAAISAPLAEEASVTGLAAVTVDAAGKILAVEMAECAAMFGWKSAELVGQNLKIVVKDWPESYLSKFMHKPGRSDAPAVSLRVTGRRMDGREFPVTMTRLAWAANATSKLNAGPAPEYWTALFGEVGDVTNSPARRNDSFGRTPLDGASGRRRTIQRLCIGPAQRERGVAKKAGSDGGRRVEERRDR
jgi:PAS domain S-box-containing protein